MQLPMSRDFAPQACDDDSGLWNRVPPVNVVDIWRE